MNLNTEQFHPQIPNAKPHKLLQTQKKHFSIVFVQMWKKDILLIYPKVTEYGCCCSTVNPQSRGRAGDGGNAPPGSVLYTCAQALQSCTGHRASCCAPGQHPALDKPGVGIR